MLHSSAATGKRSLSVTVQDNRYVAAVLLLSRNGKQILARQAVNQTEPGTETTLEFPLDGIYTNDLLVAVYDYACNVTAYQTSFGGNVEQPAANATLRAAVPGTDDTTLFLELNTEDKSSIKALNENNPLPASVLSVTRGPEGKLLLASNELDEAKNLVSTLYSVDETDYTATKIGSQSKAAYTAMAYLPHLNGGTLLGLVSATISACRYRDRHDDEPRQLCLRDRQRCLHRRHDLCRPGGDGGVRHLR